MTAPEFFAPVRSPSDRIRHNGRTSTDSGPVGRNETVTTCGTARCGNVVLRWHFASASSAIKSVNLPQPELNLSLRIANPRFVSILLLCDGMDAAESQAIARPRVREQGAIRTDTVAAEKATIAITRVIAMARPASTSVTGTMHRHVVAILERWRSGGHHWLSTTRCSRWHHRYCDVSFRDSAAVGCIIAATTLMNSKQPQSDASDHPINAHEVPWPKAQPLSNS